MVRMKSRHNSVVCLVCGMMLSTRDRWCPKCDNRLDEQTDGSTITIDIAHHGERVPHALRKMNEEIRLAKSGVARYLRLVVGSGVIREEVMSALLDHEARGTIRHFELESRNSGAILIQLKA